MTRSFLQDLSSLNQSVVNGRRHARSKSSIEILPWSEDSKADDELIFAEGLRSLFTTLDDQQCNAAKRLLYGAHTRAEWLKKIAWKEEITDFQRFVDISKCL